ncbi:toll-like receptor 5 [Clinocottus analis]|uniref:toll-like receptor 5 n=1 Tax=Clinocottus analis TaxID=304258 RepID=UPI0035C23108
MSSLALHWFLMGFTLQVTTCYPSCTLYGLVADCSSRRHYWVPALPPNITHLYLEMNHIAEINSSALRSYEQLQELDLGMQKEPLVIRNNAFLRQRRLTKLVLGYNIGLQMEPRAFAGLFRLQHLFLDYCKLSDSILADSYLQPLWSLETLDLFGNEIVRLRPGPFFSKLTKFTQLNLTLNKIERLCEEDLVGFRGKAFKLLNLRSNKLYMSYSQGFDWEACGNPFRGMTFQTLDLSINGFNVNTARPFFRAIEGTPIAHFIFSGHVGKGFSYDNLPDPDASTFEGLVNSSVINLDLSKNRIFALQRAFLSPLKDAVIIDISVNKINQINKNAFNGLQGHLRMLNLSSNLLGEIYAHTFTNLTDLRVLDLSYNHIGVLGDKAFSGLPKLRAIYLTGNSLRNLHSSAPLPNLDYLFLGDNKLEYLTEIIAMANNSIYVDVADNRLTNLEDVYGIFMNFNRLQSFFYSGNFIKWCTLSPGVTVPRNNTLQVLDLHDSSLHTLWEQGKCLDLFDNLENLLGLDLSLNSLATLPEGIFRGLNSIIEIDLSSNAFTYLQPDVFPIGLKRLDLSNNFLASPDPTAFRSLSFLSLAGNRFHCDCSLESFVKWLNATDVTFLSPTEEYRCSFPAALHNLPLLEYSTIVKPCEEDDEKAVRNLKLALFVLSALLVLGVVLGGLVYARLRGIIFIVYKKMVGRVLEGPKPAPPVDEVQHDAFLCFSDSDYGWVEAALLQKLDSQFSEENIFRCCFEARDFLPGEDHLSNIRDAVWGSRKTVCVVSKEFLKDGWCLEAFMMAQGRMLEELTNVLIVLVVGKVAHYQLMKYKAVRAFVQRREYLTWPEDPQDLDWFYERLVSQLLKDTKVKRLKAEEEPEAAQPDVRPHGEDGFQLEDVRPHGEDGFQLEDVRPHGEDGFQLQDVRPHGEDGFQLEDVRPHGEDGFQLQDVRPHGEDGFQLEDV